jgi:hypothetical protein
MYEQLERALRAAIRDGRLPAGTRLPSSRALAAELGISRGVVTAAYAQLAGAGYLETRQGAPVRVARGCVRNPPAATRRGVGIEGLSLHSYTGRCPLGLVLGHAYLAEPAIQRGVQLLAEALRAWRLEDVVDEVLAESDPGAHLHRPAEAAVEEAAEQSAATPATAEHARRHLLDDLRGHLLVLLLVLLVGAVDEAVDRLEQAVHLHLLVFDVERHLLEVEQPLPGVGVSRLRGGLKLLREGLNRVRDVLELGLQLLVGLING